MFDFHQIWRDDRGGPCHRLIALPSFSDSNLINRPSLAAEGHQKFGLNAPTEINCLSLCLVVELKQTNFVESYKPEDVHKLTNSRCTNQGDI